MGIVKPLAGYLEGIVKLCDEYGAVCIFDEVKTGFRTGLGGYQGFAGVRPHLSVFGKAVANGFPLGVIGGKREIMSLFDDPDPKRRVLIAGTYNAHPINSAAAIATLEFLENPEVYAQLTKISNMLYEGLTKLFSEKGKQFVLVNNASAFCTYFCENEPHDLHDILHHHDFEFDKKYRHALITHGIYHFPIQCKQGSVSYSHTEEDVHRILEVTRLVLQKL